METVIHRNFYTQRSTQKIQELLDTEAGTQSFDSQKLVNTEGFLHTKKIILFFTHRDAHTPKHCFYTEKHLHTIFFRQTNVHTQKLLHRNAFTHRNFYTPELQHREAFTHRNFDTEKRVHTGAFTRKSMHTKTPLHTIFLLLTINS